jgi:membrane protein DedA with SNARE-associated domain/rhodanese-related sulfurtransferase
MELMAFVAKWGLALAFTSVLLEQYGLPVLAATILVAAGALADDGLMRPEFLLAAAVAACLIADHSWFIVGRKHGRRMLGAICRLSLSPDSCVRQTDDLVARFGAPLLLVAKFIPGVSAVAIPTAAATGVPYPRFLFFDLLGCIAWSGAYIGAGMIFSREVDRVFNFLGAIGGWSVAIVGAVFALYIALKIAQRWRLRRLYRLVRITPEEMLELIANEPDILVLDARSSLARGEDPRMLPQSIFVNHDNVLEMLPEDAGKRTIVTFCTCPNEASAALLAEKLLGSGYGRVRVLAGGTDALAALASASVT